MNRQILKLEADMGAPLFERTPSGLKLTSVGELFARHVIVVLQDHDRLRSDVQSLSGSWLGSIRIAGVEALNGSLLPDVIQRHRMRAPRVTFAIHTTGSFEIQNVLIQGEADIGVAFALRHNPELRQVAIARFRLGAVVAPDHPLARRRSVSLATCLEAPLIFAGPDLSINQLLQPFVSRLTRFPEPAIQSNSIEVMRELAERGVGVSFHTRIGIERLLETGRVHFIPLDGDGEPVWADLGIYVRAGRALPAFIDVFLQDLVRETKERQEREAATYG